MQQTLATSLGRMLPVRVSVETHTTRGVPLNHACTPVSAPQMTSKSTALFHAEDRAADRAGVKIPTYELATEFTVRNRLLPGAYPQRSGSI